MSENKIAVILVRGLIGTSPDVKKTLELLRLKKKHACVVIDNNEVSRGMVQRVKDYTTFGTIDEKTYKEMLDKRGELVGQVKASTDKSFDSAKIAKEFFVGKLKLRDFESTHNLKPFFRLHPPIKGFERGGIKLPFSKKGVLGDRAEAIKDLIFKML